MESSLSLEGRIEYSKALKLGQKDYTARTSKNQRGNLPALDELTSQGRVMAFMKQPQREISLSRVIGTYTAARSNSFAGNFMPLHPENSEFASKWISLCVIHMKEGLRDPVQVYEYLWNYYVIEGNKRVSILKYFNSPSVRADITRVVPQLDDSDPDIAVYYAYLKYDKTGHFKNIRLSSQEKYTQLSELETAYLAANPLPPDTNFNAMYLQFEAAWQAVKSPLILGDAFLEYLKIYGLPAETTISQMKEQLTALLPQMELTSRPPLEPTLVLTPRDKPAPGLISRLFGSRREAKVVFAYPPGRTQDNWIGAHERGRQAMQANLGEQVQSTCLDGLTSRNIYERLSKEALGTNLLLITASELALPSLRFSLEHPDCVTLVYSRIREDYRLSTYYGRYYEAMFLCGMAAGMATEAMRVAYITPKIEYRRHTADINAFALGVKAIRNDAEVLLVWKDVLPEQPATCARGLLAAAQLGADVAYTPTFPGIKGFTLPTDVFSLVARIDREGRPTAYLAAPQWDWGRYYTEIVSSYLNGSLDILKVIDRGDPSVTGLWWGLGTGILRFLSHESLGTASNQMLHFLRTCIARGSFNPFHGPVYDQQHRLQIPEAGAPKPYDILNMEWLCHFIQVIE